MMSTFFKFFKKIFQLRLGTNNMYQVRGLLPGAVSKYEHPRVLLVLLVLLYLLSCTIRWLLSRASVWVFDALAVELNHPTVRLSRVFAFAPLPYSLLVCRFFCFFARSVAVPSVVPNSICIQLNSTYEDCCCCCACDHLRGLLLLSVPMACSIVLLGCCCCCSSSIDSLTLCSSFVIAITQLMRLYDEPNVVRYMLEVFQLHLWRPVPFLFCVSFYLIFQLRLSSHSTYFVKLLPQ